MKNKLKSKLNRYSVAAVALATTGMSAEAQVVYNQVNQTLDSSNFVDMIDINVDGIDDFAIVISFQPNNSGAFITVQPQTPFGVPGVAFAGSSVSSYYYYPFNLNAGDTINTQAFIPDGQWGSMGVYINGSNPYSGFNWDGGVTDGYLGIKLEISGATHYGWVRMDIAADDETILIKDMAYNATPNGLIQAAQGQSAVGVTMYETIANSFWISGNQLHTELLTGFTTASVSVMDISGKTMSTFDLSSTKNTFDLGELPTGIYVLSLQMDGNTFNKKAVVH